MGATGDGNGWGGRAARGQSSVEFLYSAVFALLFFVLCVTVFVSSSEDAATLSSAADARAICNAAASQISKAASAGDGAAAGMSMPAKMDWTRYSLYVAAANRSVAVTYNQGTSGVSCLFDAENVSNGSSGGSTFAVVDGARLRNQNGGVIVG